ncbi:MAG: hypothetical protein KKB79_00470 [Nanoarchaeota archaeon]|nr:hypothetical protein [Nanoarchaeota archaeon]
MKKETYRMLDLIWRIGGYIVLILFVYGMVMMYKEVYSPLLSLITIGSLFSYVVITLILFLLIKFGKIKSK